MPHSNSGGQGSSGRLRSAGRNFVSADPERQGEVAAEDGRSREERTSAHATQARTARNSVDVMRSRATHYPAFPERDSDDEGGSGRRAR